MPGTKFSGDSKIIVKESISTKEPLQAIKIPPEAPPRAKNHKYPGWRGKFF